MNKPVEFASHPTSFVTARDWGMVRAAGKVAVDGDTIIVLADIGFQVYPFVALRVDGIDTPEIVGADRERATLAREFTRERIEGRPLLVRTSVGPRTGSESRTFERYVARVQWLGPDGAFSDLGDALVAAGLAVRV